MKESIIIISILTQICSCSNNESEKFIDDFNNNKLGWIEETTAFHDLYIQDGVYTLINKDTASELSSTRYLDQSWHYDLGDQYSINSSISISGNGYDSLSCGLILECNSYIYYFTLYESGLVDISEYNYLKDETLYLKDVDSLSKTNKFDLTLNIEGWNFEFIANNKPIANGQFQCKNWNRIVPFTGKFTMSEVDYLSLTKE
ncbi:MAG: hypothetical protein AAGF87_14510 [Bacteroidota bacterium]